MGGKGCTGCCGRTTDEDSKIRRQARRPDETVLCGVSLVEKPDTEERFFVPVLSQSSEDCLVGEYVGLSISLGLLDLSNDCPEGV